MIEDQDIRAAVQNGLITEAQAAGLAALADARKQARDQVVPGEEPFVLFKGFNEIFIVIGLSILFFGWMAVTSLFGANVFAPQGFDTVLIAVVTMAGVVVVQRYFTLTRRMVAPSIALAIMMAMGAGVFGGAMADVMGVTPLVSDLIGWGSIVAIMLAHYRVFRVPFSAAIIAGAGFALIWSLLTAGGVVPGVSAELPFLAAKGPMAVVSVLFGLAVFAGAMWFDMRDPHRISTRSATGFWLHVISAPLIVNTVALRLLDHGTAAAHLLLAVFLVGLAVVAIVIDRRSFLVSSVVYAVTLIFTLLDGSAIVILLLGFGLVVLGAQWGRLRHFIMKTLPDFPGKDRLPPYGLNA